MKIELSLTLAFTILHSVSLLGSSFVEEEHQTYYFLFVTLQVLCLFTARNAESLACHLALLFLNRLARSFNQTGDKWSHLQGIYTTNEAS